MANDTIISIRKDEKFESLLLVRTAETRVASSGKAYLDLTLGDRTGNINAKMWDGSVPPPPQGSIVEVRGTGNEFMGRMQLRVERLKVIDAQQAGDISQLVPSAPYPPADMMAEVRAVVEQMRDPNLRGITTEMLDRARTQFRLVAELEQLEPALREIQNELMR